MNLGNIDMVYCWCDGNDPEFQKRKNYYLAKEKGSMIPIQWEIIVLLIMKNCVIPCGH